MPENLFPPGTLVQVRQITERRVEPLVAETRGVVEAWQKQPTGSWYAHSKNNKLWLSRLWLRKVDGELTALVLDDTTQVTRVESSPTREGE